MAKVIYFGFQKMRSWNASKVELNDKIEWVYGDFASFKNEATLWRVWLFFFYTNCPHHYTNFNNFLIFSKNIQPQIRKSWDSMENTNKKRK